MGREFLDSWDELVGHAMRTIGQSRERPPPDAKGKKVPDAEKIILEYSYRTCSPWTHYFDAGHFLHPHSPGPPPPAIRRLPPYTTNGIGAKGLDMVRRPAQPPW